LNIATLTGSAARAMGDDYGAIISHDWDLSEHMMRIGTDVGEDVWPLPLNMTIISKPLNPILPILKVPQAPLAPPLAAQLSEPLSMKISLGCIWILLVSIG